MSKNVFVNVDYTKSSIVADIAKILDKLNATYKLLNESKVPPTFPLRDEISREREKLYMMIKNLNALKLNINTLLKKYQAENSLAVQDILDINHFLINVKK